MLYNTGEPYCSQKRTDCKCFSNGRCMILTDTKFDRDCPFYKRKEQKHDEDSKNT